MPPDTELKLTREPAALSPDVAAALDSFAAEKDPVVPPRHATHVRLERDPFITHSALVPVAPRRPARGRALTVLVLLGAVGWAAYQYKPFDLDLIAAWASHVAGQINTALTPPATTPHEARRNDPPPTDSLPASNQTALSPEPERTVDTGSSVSATTVREIARPTATRPESIGTSGLLVNPVQNVSGEWRLDTHIEASDSPFEGVQLRYEMTLRQDGDRVSGVGTKFSENGEGTPGARTPVTMAGTIVGDRVTLNFVERGAQSETRGKFVLLVDETATLRGRFFSNAAQTSGRVEAHRVPSAQ